MKDPNRWKKSLKAMRARQEYLSAHRKLLIFKHQGITKELQICNKELNDVEKHIRLHGKEMRVDEHAVLRYLERVELIDPALVPEKILTPQLRQMVAAFGDGKFKLDNFRVVVVENEVKTVM